MAESRRVLVAVDDTEASTYAFSWSLTHLFKKSDHVIVLNVAPSYILRFPNPDLPNEYLVSPAPSDAATEAAQMAVTEQSKGLVCDFVAQCTQEGISCEGEVAQGEPGCWVVDEANRTNADLIVVGNHDYGFIKRTLIGSISDYVLHNASCPVAIVRQSKASHASEPLGSLELSRKIVIAVDESKEAIHAVTWALKNFCRESDSVIIYHVHHPVAPPVTAVGTGAFDMEEIYVPPDTADDVEVEALNESEKLVEKIMAYASQETKISCEGMIVTGETEAKVCEGLVSLKADTVVVGSRNRGAIARTFLGSVSDYLAHHSPCPLIVVKMNKRADGSFDNESVHTHIL